MRNLLVAILLAVLSVSRNDAAEIQDLKDLHLSDDISPADPVLDIPAPIDSVVNVDELLDILGNEEQSLDEDGGVSRANLAAGSIGSADRSLFRSYYSRNGVANTVRSLTVTYRGASAIRISAVKATEQGSSQNARVSITGGGIGSNTVSVTMTSVLGRGFYYLIEIWGR